MILLLLTQNQISSKSKKVSSVVNSDKSVSNFHRDKGANLMIELWVITTFEEMLYISQKAQNTEQVTFPT